VTNANSSLNLTYLLTYSLKFFGRLSQVPGSQPRIAVIFCCLFTAVVTDQWLLGSNEMTGMKADLPDNCWTFSAMLDCLQSCSSWTGENVNLISTTKFLAAVAEAWGTAISLCYDRVSDKRVKNPKTFSFPAKNSKVLNHTLRNALFCAKPKATAITPIY